MGQKFATLFAGPACPSIHYWAAATVMHFTPEWTAGNNTATYEITFVKRFEKCNAKSKM